jgi:hypothetical protein
MTENNLAEETVAGIGGVLLLTTIISFPILMWVGFYQWVKRHPLWSALYLFGIWVILSYFPVYNEILVSAVYLVLIGMTVIYVAGVVVFFADKYGRKAEIDTSKLGGAVYKSYYWFIVAFALYIPAVYSFMHPAIYPYWAITDFCGIFALLFAAIGDVYVGLYMVRGHTHGAVRELINKL